jgi:hypothetical protein
MISIVYIGFAKRRAGRVAAQPERGENNPGDAVQYQLLDQNENSNFSELIV